jgi:hypothetical protein
MIQGVVEATPRVRPTSGEEHRPTLGGAMPGEVVIGAIAVALDRAAN